MKALIVDNDTRAFRLHLELMTDQLNEEDRKVLRQWGKVKNQISRDIVVSPDMTLHALHYAIQRCFGWQNSHLHHFEFPKNIMDQLIGNQYVNYSRLCGLYFRFPYGFSEGALADIYWDDDYKDGEDFTRWLRRKYNPPYTYGGTLENYLMAQQQARSFLQEAKELPDDYESMRSYFEYQTGELLERNTIRECLLPLTPYEESFYSSESIEAGMQIVMDIAAECEEDIDSRWEDYREVMELGVRLEKQRKKYQRLYANKNTAPEKLLAARRQVRDIEWEYESFREALLPVNEPVVPPLAQELLYSYDYGDGWTVKITLAEELKGDEAIDILLSQKPICVDADGLSVMDDVGGVGGYCDFLRGIHGIANDGPYEDATESKEWARSMGWTGRIKNPENML